MDNCTEEVIDLFKKMFDPNPDKRITFSQIRQHSVFSKHFPDGAGNSKFLYDNKLKKFKSNIAKGMSIMGPPSRGVTKRVGTP